jgi:hypothetical protein
MQWQLLLSGGDASPQQAGDTADPRPPGRLAYAPRAGEANTEGTPARASDGDRSSGHFTAARSLTERRAETAISLDRLVLGPASGQLRALARDR